MLMGDFNGSLEGLSDKVVCVFDLPVICMVWFCVCLLYNYVVSMHSMLQLGNYQICVNQFFLCCKMSGTCFQCFYTESWLNSRTHGTGESSLKLKIMINSYIFR